jgi:glutamate 5-kinase
MAGAAASELSRGGMKTKLDAGKIATTAGTAMLIASGKRLHPLRAVEEGARATFFAPAEKPVRGWKGWIAGGLEPAGRLTIDAGAATALAAGRSLLAAGVRKVEGRFSRGDTVAVIGPDGIEVARGLVAYDAGDLTRIAGLKTAEIEAVLGYGPRAAAIHRDDLVVSGSRTVASAAVQEA